MPGVLLLFAFSPWHGCTNQCCFLNLSRVYFCWSHYGRDKQGRHNPGFKLFISSSPKTNRLGRKDTELPEITRKKMDCQWVKERKRRIVLNIHHDAKYLPTPWFCIKIKEAFLSHWLQFSGRNFWLYQFCANELMDSDTYINCTSPTEILVWKITSVLYVLTGDETRIEIIRKKSVMFW